MKPAAQSDRSSVFVAGEIWWFERDQTKIPARLVLHNPSSSQVVSENTSFRPDTNYNLAVKPDGTVAGWGYGVFGQTTSPASATNVVAIAAGYYHSLALRAEREQGVTIDVAYRYLVSGRKLVFSETTWDEEGW